MPQLATLLPPRQGYDFTDSSGASIYFVCGQPTRIPDAWVPVLRRVVDKQGHRSFRFEPVPDHSDIERTLGVQLKFPAIAGMKQ